MTQYKSQFLRTLALRGFVRQITDDKGLDDLATTSPLIGYIGFDCTAASLHVGSLMAIMMLHHLQAAGGKPIIVLGGGTSRIGDPSGRDTTRQLLSHKQILAHKASIKKNFTPFLKFGNGKTDAVIVDNNSWLRQLKFIDFLRDYGRHFSVNKMLTMESVRWRLEREQELSFLEFNYMIAQAYDFVELYRRYDCRLQMGGSDQWGNIVQGIDLGRRVAKAQLYGLTTPLVTTADGAKMGKTANGAVWLSKAMLPVTNYWQYWRDCNDADVGRFLRLFTTLPLDDIARLEHLEGAERNSAKEVLANEATRLLHGKVHARTAHKQAAAGITRRNVMLSIKMLDNGLGYLQAFCAAGLTASNSEARRLIKAGGARAQNILLHDESGQFTRKDLDAQKRIKLSAGKKRHMYLQFK